MRAGKNIKNLLWDVDVRALEEDKHADFLIKRIADKGGLKEAVWLKNRYGLKRIKQVVKKSRNVSDKTRNFWLII